MSIKSAEWKLWFQLFVTFFKIGPVTFGGGYAMIPLIEREVVEKRQWMTTKDIANIFAVAESVPGAIAINSSTFIGYRLAGPIGAIVAMTGVVLPTFCIVLLLSIFFMQVQDQPKIEAAFVSIRATIVALITYAAYKIGKTAWIDFTTFIFILITVSTMIWIHIHPVMMIGLGAIMGISVVYIKAKLGFATKLEKDEHNALSRKKEYSDIGGGI